MHDAAIILVPVLNRPQHVERLMVDVAAATPGPHRLLFIVDVRDQRELAALARAGAEYLTVPLARRSYACKINDGVRSSSEPLIFMAADDVHFHYGWLDAANHMIQEGFGVVGTKDLLNPRVMRGEHSTHTLLTREYAELGTVDEPDRVLHEGYPHEYVDDEFIGTAKMRGAFTSCDDAIVEHLHPYRESAPQAQEFASGWEGDGAPPVDNTYRRGWAGRNRGHRVHEARAHLWGEPAHRRGDGST